METNKQTTRQMDKQMNKQRGIYIVTGSSKGLGKALALQLTSDGHCVIGIARSTPDDMTLTGNQGDYIHIAYDLAKVNELDHLVDLINEQVKQSLDDGYTGERVLINNAAVLNPIKPYHKCGYEETIQHININVTAPIVMTQGIVGGLLDIAPITKVVHISSGAATGAYDGWSNYCSSKAALNMHTMVMEEERKLYEGLPKVCAYAPGIIDTGMQQSIRETDIHEFSNVERFKDFKENGDLLTPEYVANDLISHIQSKEFGDVLAVRVKK